LVCHSFMYRPAICMMPKFTLSSINIAQFDLFA
jgi:hypothetical protein